MPDFRFSPHSDMGGRRPAITDNKVPSKWGGMGLSRPPPPHPLEIHGRDPTVYWKAPSTEYGENCKAEGGAGSMWVVVTATGSEGVVSWGRCWIERSNEVSIDWSEWCRVTGDLEKNPSGVGVREEGWKPNWNGFKWDWNKRNER